MDPKPTSDPQQITSRFESLLDRAEKIRTRGLPFDDLREMGRLYRMHAARLSRLRERDDDPDAIRHLNALCVRAYTLLYASDSRDQRNRPALRIALPRALALTWRAQALAWILLFAGTFVGGVLGWRQPDALYALVPANLGYSNELLDRLVASSAARAEFLHGTATPAARNLFFGSSLFVHNTRVGLLSFAAGILAGVPTILLQLYNGVLLGAFGSIFLRDPHPFEFLAWILPHGIPELSAVTLCAAGGLLLGGAVANPGRRTRRRALREAVEPALLLFGASIPLFGLAALIESFVRESNLGVPIRLALAALLASAVVAGLFLARRLALRLHVDTGWLAQLTTPGRTAAPDRR